MLALLPGCHHRAAQSRLWRHLRILMPPVMKRQEQRIEPLLMWQRLSRRDGKGRERKRKGREKVEKKVGKKKKSGRR